MRRATAPLAVVAGLFAGLAGAVAEPGAFDMSTERPATPPLAATPIPEPSPPRETANPVAAAASAERAILPSEVLRLDGEVDSRSWNIYLTRGESESPATLTIGYKSAMVVAPESSRLRVLVNDRVALESPIAASERKAQLSIRLPNGLLRAGPNLFRVEVSQRHRTDCSIASTYELWTEIYNSESALHFDSAAAATLHRIEDLNAAGVDRHSVAHLRIIAPGLGQKALTPSLLRFAQSAAVLIGEPNETVSVADRANSQGGEGILTAVIGTASDLQSMLRSLPADAATRPIAGFLDDPVLGPSTLVISGPNTLAVSQAVDSIVALVDDPLADQRTSIATSRWFAPDAPMALGAARYMFSELGARTQEFSGRRFKTQFMVGMPADFYASAYGEATLLLDAAYSGEVLPGSQLDVFVNDQITATAPITTSGGAILRHLPIRMLMTNFKPGPNLIRFEAQLNTAADQLCPAGGAANPTSRFAIFDSSEFVMPDYARIARLPDLAALMGAGFPHSRSASPTALVINDADADTVSAASTLLARMAVAGGRILPFELVPLTAVGERNAVFVAPAGQAPGEVLAQLGIDANLRTSWKAPPESPYVETPLASADAAETSTRAEATFPTPEEPDTQATFSRWRNALSEGGGWRGNVSGLQDWLQRTFKFSAASLRFLPVADVAFEAPLGSTVMLAQGMNPSGRGAWTLLTAPTSTLLRQGADALTAQKQWSQLAGHVVTYNGKTGALATQPVTTFSFVVTQPLSFTNVRLIIANWLSDNILTYSVLLLSACILLGLVTVRFLSRIGRGAI
jgi:hypothetical protein